MSLVATTFKDGPRLVRRQTSIGVGLDRPPSPSRHMRIVSACASVPPASIPEHDRRLPPLRRPAPSASGASTPSPASSPLLPSPPVRSPLYSPFLRPPVAQGSPTSSYFPHVPSRPSSPLPHAKQSSFLPPARSKTPAQNAAVVSEGAGIPTLPPPRAAAPAPQHHPDRSETPRKNTHMRTQSGDRDISPSVLARPAVIDLQRPSISVPYVLSKATAARMPDVGSRPQIDVQSTRFAHTLSVYLPGYAADEVTLTVAKHESIKIVADKWSAAADDKCHLEWMVTFAPRDAIMSAIHAAFSKETLCVTIARNRMDNSGFARPL